MEIKYFLNRCLLILSKSLICFNYKISAVYRSFGEDKGGVELFSSLSFKRFALINNDATYSFKNNFHDIYIYMSHWPNLRIKY